MRGYCCECRKDVNCEMERAMAWANYYAEYCKNIYDGYAANRENIKSPEILEFMKDYEGYYMIKEK